MPVVSARLMPWEAQVDQARGDGFQLRQGNAALERTAEGRRNAALHRDAGVVGHGRYRCQLVERFRHRHVYVGKVVALARRQHGMQLVYPRLDGPHRALVVGNQGRVNGAGPALDAGHHLGCVAHLGHCLGMHERRDLDARQPRCSKPVDHVDLGFGGNELRLDLEPVSRAHLTNCHSLWHRHILILM